MAIYPELAEKFEKLQDDLEKAIAEQRQAFNYRIERGRVVFEKEVLRLHRQMRTRLLSYVAGARLRVVLTAPFIYSVFVPLVLLDLFVTIYQAVCFPAYGLQKVRRGDYIVFDRYKLAYLNGLEKLNCWYCSYANGLLAYVREIAARTETRWCPIKHARPAKGVHPYHAGFADFGDAEAYQARSVAAATDSQG
ncbi:hypothetical protein ACLB6G_14135 [Zhengella sp. ZM62]|uniref:hypothetical protein n=1 Tax=Zhengella sedimenti TaxID=3390035 RepID=UPI003976BEAE